MGLYEWVKERVKSALSAQRGKELSTKQCTIYRPLTVLSKIMCLNLWKE